MRKLSVLAATALFVAASPVAAHKADLFTKHRAGPIRNSKTTIGRLKDWFGEPASVVKVERGCIKVWRAKWGDRLRVYAVKHPEGGRRVAETWVQKRKITSAEHGELKMHTRRGLRVNHTVAKLKDLYPKAQRHRLKDKTFWWELLPKIVDPRLIAHTKGGVVTALVNAPYEYC
jgi:hypothetical protein